MPVRSCQVTIQDLDGVSHTVDVTVFTDLAAFKAHLDGPVFRVWMDQYSHLFLTKNKLPFDFGPGRANAMFVSEGGELISEPRDQSSTPGIASNEKEKCMSYSSNGNRQKGLLTPDKLRRDADRPSGSNAVRNQQFR
jgi:hypothetical protein